MNTEKTTGLIAATFSPMKENGDIDTGSIPAMVDKLISRGVNGIFVCGSTGEGASLTTQERKVLAEAFVTAAAKRITVFVHVGHNSISEARDLAAHAQQIGADCISAMPPCYYPVASADLLAGCLAEIAAAAPELPFYYYHIPSMTGINLDMIALLQKADIPNLKGIKYTTPTIHEYQACQHFDNRKYDLLYGTDEMMLSALATGAEGFIGSTYNFVAPLYRKLKDAFHKGDLETARTLQWKSVEIVRIIVKFGGLPAQKAMMKLSGVDCGPVRLPLRALSSGDIKSMEQELRKTAFFDWIN
ncbi:dihydrodipicolinate synthase family protein [Compostibacter hankyongensis]|uniref:N-acetylneuraminate lyase n=1 Tax=Compostibacter hankyongensis TaxID=1007089 RepID=A0ABP8G1U2_9BACT